MCLRAIATVILVFGLIPLVQAILYLIFGIGALQQSPWAWTLGIVLAILGLVVRIGSLFVDQRLGSVLADVVGIAVDAIVLIYLFQPSVRAAFRQASYDPARLEHSHPLRTAVQSGV